RYRALGLRRSCRQEVRQHPGPTGRAAQGLPSDPAPERVLEKVTSTSRSRTSRTNRRSEVLHLHDQTTEVLPAAALVDDRVVDHCSTVPETWGCPGGCYGCLNDGPTVL